MTVSQCLEHINDGPVAQKIPPQVEDLLGIIKKCIEEKKVRQTYHAIERRRQRNINLPSMMYVLKTGYHEKRKTTFDPVFKRWKYAVRGITLDELDVRVIISFDERGMIIITAISIAGTTK